MSETYSIYAVQYASRVGNYAAFPTARFWVQDEEMRVFTGRHARFYPYSLLAEEEKLK